MGQVQKVLFPITGHIWTNSTFLVPFMQPSIDILNSPSSSRSSKIQHHFNIKSWNSGTDESSLNRFLHLGEFLSNNIWSACFYCFLLFFGQNCESWPRKFSLVILHPTLFSQWWIFTKLFWKKGELMNPDQWFWWKGQQRWRLEKSELSGVWIQFLFFWNIECFNFQIKLFNTIKYTTYILSCKTKIWLFYDWTSCICNAHLEDYVYHNMIPNLLPNSKD